MAARLLSCLEEASRRAGFRKYTDEVGHPGVIEDVVGGAIGCELGGLLGGGQPGAADGAPQDAPAEEYQTQNLLENPEEAIRNLFGGFGGQ